MNLAVCDSPRVITPWRVGKVSYADPLSPMAGRTAFIELVPDSEARRAAFNIARTLIDAKWNVPTPLHLVDTLKDGVSVQPAPGPQGGMDWNTEDVAFALADFLHSYNWQARKDWWLDTNGSLVRDPKIAPVGSIKVQVGLYPPAIYVSPPGEKELTAALEERKRQEDKFKADDKLKFDAWLATLKPEDRNRAEQRQKEMDARISAMETSGPCQSLFFDNIYLTRPRPAATK